MPELPEVEMVRRTLAPAIGRRVTDVWTSGKPLRLNRPVDRRGLRAAAVGRRLTAVRRHGKYLLLDFEGGRSTLVHLGMTGRLRLHAAGDERAPHTHVIWKLGGRGKHAELRFIDARRFGMVEPVDRSREREHPSLAVLGTDPLVEQIDGAFVHEHARRCKRTLKTFLLDQGVIAGVGNIYASEALWEARLHPSLRAHRLGRRRADALAGAVVTVLLRALEQGGTTFSDFVAADGGEGGNYDYLRVYDRAEQPCPRRGCGGTVRRTVHQGRATFYCPDCQDH
jgi:formamidopyrimidine-DNA glycosylase